MAISAVLYDLGVSCKPVLSDFQTRRSLSPSATLDSVRVFVPL